MSQQGPPPWDPDNQPPPRQPGDQPPPWEQSGQPPWQQGGPGGPPRQYPRQHLLPQEVKPHRNRAPLFVGLGVVLVLIVAGVVTYLVLRDSGEDTRQAYCTELRRLTHDGDLAGALQSADASAEQEIKKVAGLAPDAVADDWDALVPFVEKAAQSGTPDWGGALMAFNALKVIAQDAKDNCGIDMPTL
ncbi:MAG TPA: hypothetical protein VH419_16640 [Nocardioidaceae bacterium]|jgi:hypothetical protein